MKLFNSLQIVSLFAGAPFGISWLGNQHFGGAGPAMAVACTVYVVSFAAMVGCVWHSIDEWK